MTLDVVRTKRRRTVMMAVNVGAAAAALASVVAWFQFGQGWALFAFIGALLVGFGTQIWFIAGLRGPGKGV